MFLAILEQDCLHRPRPGTDVIKCFQKSQEPDDTSPCLPVVTRRAVGAGTITAIHGPFFRNYFTRHYPYQRALIAEIIASLGIEWTVTIEATRDVELIQRRRDGSLMINPLNRGASEYLGPNRVMIDELRPSPAVAVAVQCERAPLAVFLHPGRAPARWEYASGTATFTVPEVPIHVIAEVEWGGSSRARYGLKPYQATKAVNTGQERESVKIVFASI